MFVCVVHVIKIAMSTYAAIAVVVVVAFVVVSDRNHSSHDGKLITVITTNMDTQSTKTLNAKS